MRVTGETQIRCAAMNDLFVSQQMVHVVTTGLQRLNKQGVTVWNGFIWLRIGTSRGGS
jgi:hypothetical protein